MKKHQKSLTLSISCWLSSDREAEWKEGIPIDLFFRNDRNFWNDGGFFPQCHRHEINILWEMSGFMLFVWSRIQRELCLMASRWDDFCFVYHFGFARCGNVQFKVEHLIKVFYCEARIEIRCNHLNLRVFYASTVDCIFPCLASHTQLSSGSAFEWYSCEMPLTEMTLSIWIISVIKRR